MEVKWSAGEDVDKAVASGELASLLAEQSNDGFWFMTLKPSPRYVYLSAGVGKIWGRPTADFLNDPKSCEASIHPTDRLWLDAAWNNWLSGVTPVFEVEYRVERPDKRIIWVRDTAEKVYDQERNLRYVAGSVRDITARKEAESDLEYRSRFEQQLTHLSTNLLNIDPLELDTYLNQALKRIGEFCKVDRAYIFTRLDLEHTSNTHEWCRANISPQIQNLQNLPLAAHPKLSSLLLAGQSVQIHEVASLNEVWAAEKAIFEAQDIVSLLAVPMISANRFEGFVGFDSVLKERRWSPEETRLLRVFADLLAAAFQRRHSDLELMKSENRFRGVFNSMFQFLAVLGPSGEIVQINETALKALSVNADAVIGSTLWHLPCWRDAESAKECRGWVIAAAKGQLIRTEAEILGTHQRVIHVDLSLKPVMNDSNTPAMIILEARDITEKREMERQFLRAQRLESLGTLSSGIAHDLNNVLAPIQNSVDLIRIDDGSHTPSLLNTIEQANARGASMIRQLLTFAKGVEGDRRPVSCLELAREVGGICTHTFPKEVEVTVVPLDRDSKILADATQLHQVLLNLCLNAKDAIVGSGRVRIEAGLITLTQTDAQIYDLASAGDYGLLAVCDTGHGISREVLDRIFEPFFTTKPVDRGSGLGLSTVLGIVKSHGGFLHVETKEGRGSCFRVFFPASSHIEPLAPPPPPLSFESVAAGKVLLVDDETLIRMTMGKILEVLSFQVVEAENGQDGFEKFFEDPSNFQLIIADVHMPKMNGLEMIQKIRSSHPDIPALICSGNPGDSMIDMVKQLDSCAFLAKPFQIGQLKDAITALLAAK